MRFKFGDKVTWKIARSLSRKGIVIGKDKDYHYANIGTWYKVVFRESDAFKSIHESELKRGWKR